MAIILLFRKICNILSKIVYPTDLKGLHLPSVFEIIRIKKCLTGLRNNAMSYDIEDIIKYSRQLAEVPHEIIDFIFFILDEIFEGTN